MTTSFQNSKFKLAYSAIVPTTTKVGQTSNNLIFDLCYLNFTSGGCLPC